MGCKFSKKRKLKKENASRSVSTSRNDTATPNSGVRLSPVPVVISNEYENVQGYVGPFDPEETGRDSEDEDGVSRDSEESSCESEDEDEDEDEEGGGEEKEKAYDPSDQTLTFTDEEDELDFECNDYKGPRAKMSCRHAATPMSLTRWCRRQLDEGQHKFFCGQTGCNAEWSFEEVCKMGLFTPEEIEYFEKKMFINASTSMEIKQCPGCKSLVERNDLNNLNVECNVCTSDRGKTYRFCWQCLKKWKGPAPRSDRCENEGCQNPLDILKTCPEIVFKEVAGVKGCPRIRACPTCGLLLEHTAKQCKSMVCPGCKVKFCFVCLSFSKDCLQRNAYEKCPNGVAPRQTSIIVSHMD